MSINCDVKRLMLCLGQSINSECLVLTLDSSALFLLQRIRYAKKKKIIIINPIQSIQFSS